MVKVIWLTYLWPEDLITIHVNFRHPKFIKGNFIHPFMARTPDDYSFGPLPNKNISKVIKLTHSQQMHPNINRLIFCNSGNVKGYWINPFMAWEYDDHLFNPQPTKNISKVTLPLPRMIEYGLKVVKLTHSWPEHLNVFI